jgi:hypothetical protein
MTGELDVSEAPPADGRGMLVVKGAEADPEDVAKLEAAIARIKARNAAEEERTSLEAAITFEACGADHVRSDEITPEILLKVRRVSSVMKHFPGGISDTESLANVAGMNRHDRRSLVTRMRKKAKKALTKATKRAS